jgi:two-component system, OmpR family, response regulator
MSARLLVVDDEPNIVELLSASLRFAGYDVSTATHGTEALRKAREIDPDLIVLDVMMPGIDGFEVVRRLRGEERHVPVLFLTARDAVEDKVQGLHTGGDDYVTKPFSLDELVARVRALLRRSGHRSAKPSEPAILRYADLELNEDSYEVFKAGRPVSLSLTEFKLLRCLLENAERVMSKGQILSAVWNYDFAGDAGVVESYMSYLRRKVDTGEPKLLHTVRGVGYVLRTPRGRS